MEGHTLITTADGSHSLVSEQFKVAYHSHHGAIQETNHVFIEAGMLFQIKRNQPLRILELGLGTGLNTLVTYLKAAESAIPVSYTSLEQFPIPWELAEQCNFLEQLDAPEALPSFQKIHCGSFEDWHSLSPDFRFRKIQEDAAAFSSDDRFTLIYYDAFAPESQPKLWTEEIFRTMYGLLEDGGVLVTYCAKGVVKRALKAVGFTIESIPGPPGKREMTRAIKL
ncbi:MAG: tRNA U34 5-methylaminomethyl-2-thiouridine-forming methyltransferase MnmC [Polaribacter sp.]|jgi:tRNA U34 5-methylaminomethyl-2-thiouridine-forming methyltransferase MnmC